MKNVLLFTFLTVILFFVNTAFPQPDPNFYDAYTDTLKLYVDEQGMVDYSGLKQNHFELDSFLSKIAQFDDSKFEKWSDNDKIAFWLNVYNALVLKTVIDHYPIRAGRLTSLIFPKNSIHQIPGVWTGIEFDVMGQQVPLDHIEHKILRVQFNEPRIHMSLVCASIGCPLLRNESYAGDILGNQLDDQTRKFLSNPQKFRVVRDKNVVYLSSIFDWFDKDFLKKYSTEEKIPGHSRKDSAVLDFIASYVDKNDRDYIYSGKYKIKFLKYDWSLNEQHK